MKAFIIGVIFLATFSTESKLLVTSTAFKENQSIPSKYTCDGENKNPPLNIDNIPAKTTTLALIMDDPDAAKGVFDHWILFNIPVKGTSFNVAEDTSPGVTGANGHKENNYMGPCPPMGVHHYHFKFFALDTRLTLTEGADKKSVEEAMKGHVLAEGELVGLYGTAAK
jgi:Raf kinase inhibitor-like YbhB/YbcL family protein